jgi:glutathione peroxidase
MWFFGEHLGTLVVVQSMTLKDIELKMIDGAKKTFADFANGPVLVVNVASRCGLTPQYEALEGLQKKYASKGFTVLGVPSGQFFQELADEEAISEYCSTTWGVTFPMTEKSKVNGRSRHALYKELVKAKDSTGKAGPVMWNFEKFLVLPTGEIKRFRPTMKPDDAAIIEAIEQAL